MKKTAILLLMSGFITLASAQNLFFQFNGGVNLCCQNHVQEAVQESWDAYFQSVGSTERVSHIKKVLFIPGFNLGISLNIPMQTAWAFRTGLDFNIKGGKAEGNYGTGSSKTPFSNKWVYGYVDLPAVVQYWINKQFYLEAGPDIGFLLSVKATEEEDGNVNFENKDKEDYKKIEVSISGGGGYLFGDSGFGAFVRYIHGLTKVYTGEPYYSNVRNSTGQVGFFYRIQNLKKD